MDTDTNEMRPVADGVSQSALIKALGTWQPIETAPKDGTRILLTNGTDVSIGAYEWCSGFYGAWTNEYDPQPTDGPGAIAGWWTENPSYWMPLPAPPEST